MAGGCADGRRHRLRRTRRPVSRKPSLVVLLVLLVESPATAGCTGQGSADRPSPAVGTSQGQPAATSRGDAATGPPLRVARAVHRATTLRDGRVLFTGGCSSHGCAGVAATSRTEVFDPVSRTMQPGPQLRQARLSHTATLLADGRVLVVGGYPGEGASPTASVEVVDPGRGAVRSAGSLQTARADHTASLLPDGRVLVAGGRGADGEALRSTEIVDVSAGRFVAGPDLPAARTAHTATSYAGGVLLVGGTSGDERALASTVFYAPGPARWVTGPELLRARVKHAAVAVRTGGVLVLGGAPDVEARERFDDTEVLDPASGRFRPGPRLSSGRYKISDAVVALPDGRVVVAGGPTLDVLDLTARGGRSRIVDLSGLGRRRSFQTASAVAGSRVLVAGGYDDAIDPTQDTWLVRVGTRCC